MDHSQGEFNICLTNLRGDNVLTVLEWGRGGLTIISPTCSPLPHRIFNEHSILD